MSHVKKREKIPTYANKGAIHFKDHSSKIGRIEKCE